jgi:hypothetical protein
LVGTAVIHWRWALARVVPCTIVRCRMPLRTPCVDHDGHCGDGTIFRVAEPGAISRGLGVT